MAVWPEALILAALLSLSAGVLAFEVLLTRLLSPVLQYHFAFLAISVAILGLGLGAMLGARLGLAARPDGAAAVLPWVLAGFGASLPAAAVAIMRLPVGSPVLVYAVVGLVPFCLAGFFASTVYARWSSRAPVLYGADLLGATLGLGLSLALMSRLGPLGATLGFGAGCALVATALSADARSRLIGGLMTAAGLAGLAAAPTIAFVDLPSSRGAVAPDKTLFRLLSDPSQGARVIETVWGPFARVDVVETGDRDQKFVFTDGGAGSYMLRLDGGVEAAAGLREELEYLPFVVGPVEKTLVLGAGAGKDVVQALLADARQVTAVEVNPAMVATTRRYSEYNGAILDHPRVETLVADARNFVERTQDRYELIYLNLVYTQAPQFGSAALTEAFVFTEEAFRAYWRRLDDDGRLAIVSHQALEGSRALLTAVSALDAEGLSSKEVLERSLLFMYPHPDPNQRASVMILRKSPWTPREVGAALLAGRARGLQPLFAPGVFEETLAGLVDGTATVDDYLVDDEFDLSPTTDDRPFFFNFHPGPPAPVRNLFWGAFLITFGYLAVALLQAPRPVAWQLGYFGLLGLGLMLIEVSLIQRSILLLGSPTLALVVVVGGLLLGLGGGSLLSRRWADAGLWRRVGAAALVGGGLAVAAAFMPHRLTLTFLTLPLAARAVAVGLPALALGLPLGAPFPSGLRFIGGRQPHRIPLLWGWNAVTSVLGSVLAVVVAMEAGFTWALALGGVCYLGVAALVRGRR